MKRAIITVGKVAINVACIVALLGMTGGVACWQVAKELGRRRKP